MINNYDTYFNQGLEPNEKKKHGSRIGSFIIFRTQKLKSKRFLSLIFAHLWQQICLYINKYFKTCVSCFVLWSTGGLFVSISLNYSYYFLRYVLFWISCIYFSVGPISCYIYGIDGGECEFESILCDQFPVECNSYFYMDVTVDLSYNVKDSTSRVNDGDL